MQRPDFLARPQKSTPHKTQKAFNTIKEVLQFKQHTKPHDSAILPLGRAPKTTEDRYSNKILRAALATMMPFTAARMSVSRWMDKQKVLPCNGILFTVQGNEVLICATTEMNFENTRQSERNQAGNVTFCLVLLIQTLRRGKSIEAESRLVIGRCGAQRGRGTAKDRGDLSFPWSLQWDALEMEVLHQDRAQPVPPALCPSLSSPSVLRPSASHLHSSSLSPPPDGWP